MSKTCRREDCNKCQEKDCIWRPQTNADRICSMTTEELSEYLYNHDFCIEPVKSNGQNLCDGDCKKCIEDWLKSPVGGATDG